VAKKLSVLVLALLSGCWSSMSNAATYQVTDVICNSGAAVNLRETLSPGSKLGPTAPIDGPRVVAALAESVRTNHSETQVNPLIASILAGDPSKQVVFFSTSGFDFEYKSGKGPCPQSDVVVGLGRLSTQSKLICGQGFWDSGSRGSDSLYFLVPSNSDSRAVDFTGTATLVRRASTLLRSKGECTIEALPQCTISVQSTQSGCDYRLETHQNGQTKVFTGLKSEILPKLIEFESALPQNVCAIGKFDCDMP